MTTFDVASGATGESGASPAGKSARPGGGAPAPAGGSSDLMVVVVEGVGETSEEASKDAFRNAVRQVVGAVVDAETLIKDDQVITDKVITYSDGFIEKSEILSESQKGGLHRKRVRATVRRRSVVARLKEANVSVAGVDGQSLFAEAVTQLEAEKNAAALAADLFKGYPESVLRAEVREKPEIADKAEGRITLRYRVRVRFDPDKYEQFLGRAVPVLERIAARKGDWDLVARTPDSNSRPRTGEPPAHVPRPAPG